MFLGNTRSSQRAKKRTPWSAALKQLASIRTRAQSTGQESTSAHSSVSPGSRTPRRSARHGARGNKEAEPSVAGKIRKLSIQQCGCNLPVIESHLLCNIRVLQRNIVFVLQKMCEACMLHSRVIMQALLWNVEMATQEM